MLFVSCIAGTKGASPLPSFRTPYLQMIFFPFPFLSVPASQATLFDGQVAQIYSTACENAIFFFRALEEN